MKTRAGGGTISPSSLKHTREMTMFEKAYTFKVYDYSA